MAQRDRKRKFLSILTFTLIGICAILIPVQASAAGHGQTTVITDAAGRKVTLPTSVKRIIPLGGTLRFVTYLQGLDTVVGIEAMEKKGPEAARLYGLAVADKVKKLPVVSEGGPGGKLPDFEQIIAVRPDLIIAVGLDKSQLETIQQKTGIPALSLNSGAMTALDLKKTRESITLLGHIIDRGPRAATLIAFIDQLETDLDRRTASRSERPKVYVGAVGFKGRHGITSTEAAYAPLAWVHGSNVADALKQPGHAFIDQEKLLLWNPDVIFLDAGGMEMVRSDALRNPAFYEMLKAVNDGRVYVMPPYNFYHTNIETALANGYFIGKTLYPDAFTDIDPKTKADEIFDFFIGIKAYDRLQKEFHGYARVSFDKEGISIH